MTHDRVPPRVVRRKPRPLGVPDLRDLPDEIPSPGSCPPNARELAMRRRPEVRALALAMVAIWRAADALEISREEIAILAEDVEDLARSEAA